ncbi:MAG: hypothetical protein PHD81_03145 [Candidatus Nanoarchaeia archaeon]|nr:hypothetical protein [Candidatus Nanoarchaeia archaeon]MDD5588080.1 hypothetical protein [Candidatus Nanoarchaeia archaeon]
MNTLEFVKELKDRRSIKAEAPKFNLEKKGGLSESCLGLCVE